MAMKVYVRGGDAIDIELPSGQVVNILYSDIDDDALPEIDIMLPEDLCVNCFMEHLEPSKPDSENPNVLESRQLIIPVRR